MNQQHEKSHLNSSPAKLNITHKQNNAFHENLETKFTLTYKSSIKI